MRVKEFEYEHNGIYYPVVVTRKRMKNITYRYRDGKFYISAPWYSLKSDFIRGLDKFADRLLIVSVKPAPRGENYIYLLGEKLSLDDSHMIAIKEGTTIVYNDEIDMDKKLKKWFLSFISERVNYYQKLMNVEPYKVHVKNMSSRYGSNSKHTKSLNFALILMHYSIDIIDSVVVHELAHTLVYNHSKAFYNVVYKYFPNYNECHSKLRKGIFQ
ncbi:MAG: M48 family metallopeptidase [Bacilli bacterium]|nr:M48 family metallopeptidase [Bacilli bacterium]